MSTRLGCEVCGQGHAEVVLLELDTRAVRLCASHAQQARRAGAATFGDLGDLFRERDGRRTLVPRRATHDRRLFPPRPEGRRREAGRRASDAE